MRRRIVAVVFQAALFLGAFLVASAYQARNMLGVDEFAPELVATTLRGVRYDLGDNAGQPTLVYFFAPWCKYCSASADNIVRLRGWREETDLHIVAVALEWTDRDDVEAFAKDHHLNMPVLLGNKTVASDWNVYGFPTYYVLDGNDRVLRRDIGYSTQLGLWWRTWLAK